MPKKVFSKLLLYFVRTLYTVPLSIFSILYLFLGETFESQLPWSSAGFADVLVSVPDPYGFCFERGLSWTCHIITDSAFDSSDNFITPSKFTNEIRETQRPEGLIEGLDANRWKSRTVMQCRLNGKPKLKLNEHLGEKMPPLDSRTVSIEVKVIALLVLYYEMYNAFPN